AVRRCGFAPIAVNGVVAALAGEIATVAARAAVTADLGTDPAPDPRTDRAARLDADLATNPAQGLSPDHTTDLSAGIDADPVEEPGTDPAADLGTGLTTNLGLVAAALAGELPAAAAPRLDLLAEMHARAEVRLFAS